MPKKAIRVKSHLRNGAPVQQHVRLVEYEPKSSVDAVLNAGKRTVLRLRALADDDEFGTKAVDVLHDEWVTLRTAFKNKIRRYTDKVDGVFTQHEGLPIEGAVSAPAGIFTFIDTLRDFGTIGAFTPLSVVSAGAMAIALAFLPIATYANNRIANYTGKNPLITIPQKLFKPYTGSNGFRQWLNRPEVARSIVNGTVGLAGTGLAFATGAAIAPVLLGLTFLEVVHEHAIAHDARNKMRTEKMHPMRRWLNDPKTMPRALATLSAGTAAFTLGAPVALIGAAAVGSYQMQKWLQRAQAQRTPSIAPDVNVTQVRTNRIEPAVAPAR